MLLIHPHFGLLRLCEADSAQLQPDSTHVTSAVPTGGCLQGWDEITSMNLNKRHMGP